MRKLYEQACQVNQALTALYQRLKLPIHNYYALSHEILRCDSELQKDEDYLVLLVSLWCPIAHLLGSWQSPIEQCLRTDKISNVLKRYQELEPDDFQLTTDRLTALISFSNNIADSSINLPLRFQSYCTLLDSQQNQFQSYQQWKKLYDKHYSDMKAETEDLWKDSELIEPELLLSLFLIFQQYVRNLMVDSKNRSKYQPVKERVAQYITALQCEMNDLDSIDADDVIGTIFERLLINATQYEPLSLIGPAYVCWIFEKRILKIGNPNSENVNLLLINNTREELFPLKAVWHSQSPTIADQAQIYLFDALCALWDKYRLGETTLSKFLFERTMPVYPDFMKTNHHSPSSERVVTNQHVTYPISMCSSDFFQRAYSVIKQSLLLSPQSLPWPSQLTQEEWLHHLCPDDSQTDEQEVPLLNAYFKSEKALIQTSSTSRRKIKINFEQLFPAIYNTVSQKKYINEYERLFLLDCDGLGSNSFTEHWKDQVDDFFNNVRSEIDFDWNVTPNDIRDCFLDGLEQDTLPYLRDAVFMICSKVLYHSYLQDLLIFSKKALFQKYTAEQYDRLFSFIDKPLLEADTLVVHKESST